MDYDLSIAIFRLVVLLFIVRQFWNSFFGGIFSCLLLVSPIALYLGLRYFETPVDVVYELATANWNLLFSRPMYHIHLLMNVGATLETLLNPK